MCTENTQGAFVHPYGIINDFWSEGLVKSPPFEVDKCLSFFLSGFCHKAEMISEHVPLGQSERGTAMPQAFPRASHGFFPRRWLRNKFHKGKRISWNPQGASTLLNTLTWTACTMWVLLSCLPPFQQSFLKIYSNTYEFTPLTLLILPIPLQLLTLVPG